MNRVLPKYLLFAGDSCYPDGGWDDLIGGYGELKDAQDAGVGYDWAHIVCLSTGKKVCHRFTDSLPMRKAKDTGWRDGPDPGDVEKDLW